MDERLAKALLRSYDNEAEDRNVREAAYRAMARAAGLEWSAVPSSSRHFDLSSEVRNDVVDHLRHKLGGSRKA